MKDPLASPPTGWVPPSPPALADVARTLRVVCTDIVPYWAKLGLRSFVPQPSTTDEAGLALVRESFSATIRRLGIDLEVLHADRVPRSGGVVFMWNQESHLDHLVLGATIPRPFFSLYNNAVAKVPFYGAQMRAAGHVHVDRNDEAQWRASVARAADRVHAGECVLVSPEGTRSWDGRLLPMKRGALILACAARSPVVCATVIGGHARMPRGSSVVRAGPMRVVFAEPIAAARADEPDEHERLRAALVDAFERTKRAHAL